MNRRQLMSSDDAVDAKAQHTKPCSDCPWARTALNGWLGGMTPEDWLKVAHSDATVDCHTLRGAQCAGIAIYRRNVCKRADRPNLQLEADRETVFATWAEFLDHHTRLPPELGFDPITKKGRADG